VNLVKIQRIYQIYIENLDRRQTDSHLKLLPRFNIPLTITMRRENKMPPQPIELSYFGILDSGAESFNRHVPFGAVTSILFGAGRRAVRFPDVNWPGQHPAKLFTF
jgi:hypothetical protein